MTTPAEQEDRRLKVRRLYDLGLSISQICERLGMNRKLVNRDLAAMGIPAKIGRAS